jgi:hypothetical protein
MRRFESTTRGGPSPLIAIRSKVLTEQSMNFAVTAALRTGFGGSATVRSRRLRSCLGISRSFAACMGFSCRLVT